MRRRAMTRVRTRADEAITRAAHLVGEAAQVPTMADMRPRLARELDRARRYEYPIAIVVLDVPVGSPRAEPTGNGTGDRSRVVHDTDESIVLETRVPHLVSLLSGALLCEVLRESDIVVYDPRNDRLILLLVHSDRAETKRATERLSRLIRARLHLSPRIGSAHFVEDGLTLEDLLACAQHRWREELPESRLDEEGDGEPAAALTVVGDASVRTGGR